MASETDRKIHPCFRNQFPQTDAKQRSARERVHEGPVRKQNPQKQDQYKPDPCSQVQVHAQSLPDSVDDAGVKGQIRRHGKDRNDRRNSHHTRCILPGTGMPGINVADHASQCSCPGTDDQRMHAGRRQKRQCKRAADCQMCLSLHIQLL